MTERSCKTCAADSLTCEPKKKLEIFFESAGMNECFRSEKNEIMDIVGGVCGNYIKSEEKQIMKTESKKESIRDQILEMTAKRKGCKVSDLESKQDKHGNIHVRMKKDG